MNPHSSVSETTAPADDTLVPHGDRVAGAGYESILKHLRPDEIPPTADVLYGESLTAHLAAARTRPFTLLAVGDIMMGARASRTIRERGADYPFAGVMPLLARAEA